MKKQPYPLLLLALIALFPQGITGEIYATGAAEIAGSLGLSLDESSLIQVLNMTGQLITLPLAAWLAYRIGSRSLFRAGAGIGLVCAFVSSLWLSPTPQLIAWFGHGIAASALLLCAHNMVLNECDHRTIAWVEAIMLFSVVLVPMSIYPHILAYLAENNLWHFSFAVQVSAYLAMIYWAVWGRWPFQDKTLSIPFNGLQALLMSGFIAGLTYILFRGEHYNWLRSPYLVNIILVTLVLGMLLIASLVKGWGKGEYIRTGLLTSRHGIAGMVDAAVAGFSIFATNLLTGNFITQVMGYSHEQLGNIEMVSFGGMAIGAIISLFMTISPKRDPEKVVPLGVLILVISVVLLTRSNPYSGMADLWLPMLLKGLAIGILNLTLTIHILRSFPAKWRIEGIAWFYLFRNLGSLIAIALFNRLITFETQSALSRLAENFNSLNATFIHYQEAAMALLQESVVGATPERSALLLGQQLQTQAMAVAGVNNYQWFIFAMLVMVPVMGAVMNWAKKEPH